MLYYDKIILSSLIYKINLKEKVILDYGCGTGRNWPDLLKYSPDKIIGCDISEKMLDILKLKFDNARTYLVNDDKLSFLKNNSVDIIISTLVIAHLKDLNKVFIEWDRVLKSSGCIIITDFHPELLAAGGSRTFKHKNTSITIENYIHRILEIESLLSPFGFRTVKFIEKKIEPDVKHFYKMNNALQIYEKFEGTPFIYGILLSRQHAD
jgi:ubiquinone/menaquinone biosynthesis C-methylase UbiE